MLLRHSSSVYLCPPSGIEYELYDHRNISVLEDPYISI